MGMTASMGMSRSGASGISQVLSAMSASALPALSRCTHSTLAPRARTSLMLERVLSSRALCVSSATTSVPGSMSAIVPCLSSPAA